MFSLTVLMVEGLACFRVDISQKEKSMVVCCSHRFFVLMEFSFVLTYPPDPIPLLCCKRKGEYKNERGWCPS